MNRITLGIASAVILATGGCGSHDEAAVPKASTTPSTVQLTVVIHDAIPLQLYFNGGQGSCTSDDPLAGVLGSGDTPAPRIVVTNAAGDVVATEEAPASSPGAYTAGQGCNVSTSLTVPASDFYTVKVTGGPTSNITADTTAKRAGAMSTANLTF